MLSSLCFHLENSRLLKAGELEAFAGCRVRAVGRRAKHVTESQKLSRGFCDCKCTLWQAALVLGGSKCLCSIDPPESFIIACVFLRKL